MADEPEVRCLRCGAEAEFQGKKSLVDAAPISIVRHWVHVNVYQCVQCGHLEIFAAYPVEQDFTENAPNPTQSDFPSASGREREEALRRIGVVTGPLEIPSEDPVVAAQYEEDAAQGVGVHPALRKQHGDREIDKDLDGDFPIG